MAYEAWRNVKPKTGSMTVARPQGKIDPALGLPTKIQKEGKNKAAAAAKEKEKQEAARKAAREREAAAENKTPAAMPYSPQNTQAWQRSPARTMDIPAVYSPQNTQARQVVARGEGKKPPEQRTPARLGDAARRAENTKHAENRARTVISRMTDDKKSGDLGSGKKAMSRNSEDWARLEHARRTLPHGSPLKKNIPRFQDELHARNVALAAKENEKKAKLAYDQPSGEWRNTDGERAYKTKGTPQRPLAEGKEYTALDRLGRAGKSIGKSFVGMLPAMVETSQQIAEDTETDSKKPRLVAMQNEAESLRAWLNTVPFETAGETPEYKQKSARYQELLEQIKGASTQTVVDGDKFGQRTMRESARDAAKATEGMTGTGKFLADTGISIANSAVTLPTAAISPAMPLALMGTQAAAKKTVELNARGIAPKEALGRGIVAGGIEAATEKIPVDTLLDVIKSGGKSALKNILKQAGIEATEEGVSYVAGYLADVAANDPEASFSLEELGANALGGFLSGGFTGAVGTAVGKIGQYVDGRKRAQAARGTPAKTDTARANTPQEAAGAEMRGLLSDAKKDEAIPIYAETNEGDRESDHSPTKVTTRSTTSSYINSITQMEEKTRGCRGCRRKSVMRRRLMVCLMAH